ncbi:hypothetical protein StoSoilB13_28930 (plasmid) [Arthrobacter sp. StoSoilB13]|nr:hypothetical protein StoSoilB13_28930 [Arthrobacter sp. StoSoilB13]
MRWGLRRRRCLPKAPNREAVGIGAEHRKVADCPCPIARVKDLPGFMVWIAEDPVEPKNPRAITASHVGHKFQGPVNCCQECCCVIEVAAPFPRILLIRNAFEDQRAQCVRDAYGHRTPMVHEDPAVYCSPEGLGPTRHLKDFAASYTGNQSGYKMVGNHEVDLLITAKETMCGAIAIDGLPGRVAE